MSQTPPKSAKPTGSRPSRGSRRTPRGSRLRARVNFFEEMFESLESSMTSGDSSFEESFERMVEEGELSGSKVVKFEKITLRKSVKEIAGGGDDGGDDGGAGSVSSSQQRDSLAESSRTPSEKHALEDSDYQSRSHGAANHGSKSSSIASFARLPSDESLSHRRGSGSPQHLVLDDRTPSEWYAEYCTQRFQNIGSRIEYVCSMREYDTHIAEIKGIPFDLRRDRGLQATPPGCVSLSTRSAVRRR